jgi:asparagine synthase (glutamine-hydrolysing)
MCGIAGFIGNLENSDSFLISACEKLERRGPDGHGSINVGWAGLAHTRLSLIDLSSSGSQPQEYESMSIAFNGEIYNWQILKNKMIKLGIGFETASDTEVLLKSIYHFGLLETLSEIRGIFTFAVLDKLKQEIYLVRDRFGTKPLYYTDTDNSLTFASEISALPRRRTLSKESLEEYLTFQNLTGNATLFNEIKLVEPGTILKIDLNLTKIEKIEWTNLVQKEISEATYSENLEHLEKLIKIAVARNLTADVPVGTFLSGGIDSGILAIFGSKINPDINSFTAGFNTTNFSEHLTGLDERAQSAALAQQLGIPNLALEINEDDMWSCLKELADAIEDPRVGQSYPNYYASKLARTRNKAVLAGTGGDEFFGGYPWRYTIANSKEYSNKESQLHALVKFWHRLLPSDEIALLCNLNKSEHESRIENKIQAILDQNAQDSSKYTTRDLMYFDMKLFLHGLLIVEDKVSMHNSLEVRVPMLDEDLVNFSLTLPEHHLVKWNKLDSPPIGKIILRDIMAKQNVGHFGGVKKGFTGPDEEWFRNEKKVTTILTNDARIWDYLDRFTTLRILEQHFNGTRNLRLFIWSLIQLELTIRKL